MEIAREIQLKDCGEFGDITVKNVPEYFFKSYDACFLVVTKVASEFWFYGVYEDSIRARDAIVDGRDRYFFYIDRSDRIRLI